MPYDQINPSHYRSASGLESIDIIETFFPDKPHRWAAMKYLFRAGKKPGQDEVQDLRKAIWWIEREIAHIARERMPNGADVLAKPIPVASVTGTDDKATLHTRHSPGRWSPWTVDARNAASKPLAEPDGA